MKNKYLNPNGTDTMDKLKDFKRICDEQGEVKGVFVTANKEVLDNDREELEKHFGFKIVSFDEAEAYERKYRDAIVDKFLELNKDNPDVSKDRIIFRMDGRMEWLCPDSIGHPFFVPNNPIGWNHGCNGNCKAIQVIEKEHLEEIKIDESE